MPDWRKNGHQHQDPQQALPGLDGWFSQPPVAKNQVHKIGIRNTSVQELQLEALIKDNRTESGVHLFQVAKPTDWSTI